MFQCSKDRYTKMYKFKQDDNGELLRDKKGWFISESLGRQKNPAYIPGALKKRPKWCIKKYGKNPKYSTDMTPHPDCEYPKCPFLALSEVDESEYKVMLKAWEDAGKKGEFKHLEDGIEPVKTPHSKKKSN